VRMATRTAPRARLEIVEGGHQVLDEPGRRSVAALTLLFLERVRADRDRAAPPPAHASVAADL